VFIKIIAHRGWWQNEVQQNTEEAFRKALSNGFGIETDIRDYKEGIVISHDLANMECISFDEFLCIVKEYPMQELALNIKSDGLQSLIANKLFCEVKYFCFDMSVPDMLGYIKMNLNTYSRCSEIERKPSLLDKCQGVWLDNFSSNELDLKALGEFLLMGKYVTLVSPELHKYEYFSYWEEVKSYLSNNSQYINQIGLCTDFPMEAKEFFKNE